MKPFLTLLTVACGLWAMPAAAQFNNQNIEKTCMGGKNIGGLYVCTCDQGWISGMAAMILGNVQVMHGPGTLQNCLEWANEMNGVAPARPLGNQVTPPALGKVRPPEITPPSIVPPTIAPPPIGSARLSMTWTPLSGPCGEIYNSCRVENRQYCLSDYNHCTEAGIEANRQDVLSEGTASVDQVEDWRAQSQPSPRLVMPPDHTDTVGASQKQAIKLFSAVKTVSSETFLGQVESSIVISPTSYLGQALNVVPPWRGSVTIAPGSQLTVAGDAEGTKPWYIDNVLIFCFDGKRCVSVGQRDAIGMELANGGQIEHVGGMGFNFDPTTIDLSPYVQPGSPVQINAWAIDYGGAGGVSDVYLIFQGSQQGADARIQRRTPPQLPSLSLTQPPELGLSGNRSGSVGNLGGALGR